MTRSAARLPAVGSYESCRSARTKGDGGSLRGFLLEYNNTAPTTMAKTPKRMNGVPSLALDGTTLISKTNNLPGGTTKIVVRPGRRRVQGNVVAI